MSVMARIVGAAALVIGGVAMASVSLAQGAGGAPDRAPIGSWRAWVETPGGSLPFRLEVARGGGAGALRAWMVNGPERLEIPVVSFADGTLTLKIDYFDSAIEARVVDGGDRLEGSWSKRRGPEEVATLPFGARLGEFPLFEQIKPARGTPWAPREQVAGRWRVRFKDDPDGAIGVFEIDEEGGALGTFLTPTGDYRSLAGVFDGTRLRLSCFDGSHAFLFDARVVSAGGPGGGGGVSLEGDFWSGAHAHDTWTATRDDSATLPDAWGQTAPVVMAGAGLGELEFLDQSGAPRRLDDPAFAGQARIIEVFGSWCPNCFDATHYLKELHQTYGPRGLAILGIAFEVTGDRTRDLAQIRTYVRRTGIEWPVLLGGRANKEEASRALPMIDRLRSYPTFLFVDGSGRVRAVYTGFSGPATGAEHRKLRAGFTRLIEAMLAGS